MADDNEKNWFQATFSTASTEEDVVKSRSLNITRITGLVVAALGGISAGLKEFSDVEPFNDIGFQRHLVLALIGLMALVAVADILGRSLATVRASTPASVVLPGGVPASLSGGVNHRNVEGMAVAFRTSTASSASVDGEYLFVRSDGNGKVQASWEKGSVLEGVGT
jgi:hypothetical protein